MVKMILDKLVRRLKLNKRPNVCSLCSESVEIMSENENLNQTPITEPKKKEIKKRTKLPSKKHRLELEQLFHGNKNLVPHKDLIPENLLNYVPYNRPDHMYLISPSIAKKVADYILLNLNDNNQIVAETSPGFGYIAKELSNRGVPNIRLYEYNTEFQKILGKMYGKSQFQLFNKNFFQIYLYSYVDRYDQGSRVASLLKGVPKKSWVDDPVMTVVGPLTGLSFIRYLIKSIVLQRELATYGRIDVYALMFPVDWLILSATKDDSPTQYRPWTVLFQIFFELKLLDKFPRKLFLPWEAKGEKKKRSRRKHDPDNVYLVQIRMKKDFCLNAQEFVPFFCFIRTFLGSGNKMIIPTCEKWIPDCGVNLIVPKLQHDDYFEDMSIFTKFKELSPKQIVAVFKEITSLPGYLSSPFSDMVEQELIKSETINSDLHAAHKQKRQISASDFELK